MVNTKRLGIAVVCGLASIPCLEAVLRLNGVDIGPLREQAANVGSAMGSATSYLTGVIAHPLGGRALGRDLCTYINGAVLGYSALHSLYRAFYAKPARTQPQAQPTPQANAQPAQGGQNAPTNP